MTILTHITEGSNNLFATEANILSFQFRQKTVSAASSDVVAADIGYIIRLYSASAPPINLPAGLPSGFWCVIVKVNTGDTEITADTTFN